MAETRSPIAQLAALVLVTAGVFAPRLAAAQARTSAAADPGDGSLRGSVVDLIGQLRDGDVRAVAVVDFTDLRGNVLELGRYLAEEVSGLLVREGRPLQVVTRTRLNALLAEHQLTPTGLLDPANSKKLGLISGVDALVTGTTTPLADSVRVSLQVLDTETGHVIAAAFADVERGHAIDALLRREVQGGAPADAGGVGEYQGQLASQQIRTLAVYLRSFELMADGGIRVTLDLRNTDPDGGGLALAWAAVGSGGIADYWKFFPQVDAVVTDDTGGRWEFASASGLGWARTREDWQPVEASGEATAVVELFRRRDRPPGRVFSFSAPIRMAWRPRAGGDVQMGEFNILLQNIRPSSP